MTIQSNKQTMIVMRRVLCLFAVAVFISSGITRSASAQDSTASGVALPDLAPREVEIRGDLVISFPSLQRQPLIGFNPPPRVPDIPADRRPYVHEYKQTGEELPESPLVRPAPPSVASLSSGEQAFGEVEATTGNYFNRAVIIRAGFPVNPATSIELDIDYTGSNGNAVFDDFDEIANEFDTFEGRLDLRHDGPTFRGSVSATGFSDMFNLYPLATAVDAPSFNLAPDRQIDGLGGGITVGTGTTSRVKFDAGIWASQTRMDTKLASAGTIPKSMLERTEQAFAGELGSVIPAGGSSIIVDASGGINRLDSGDPDEEENLYASGGVRFRTLVGNSLEISAGGQVLAITVKDQETRRASYISPAVRITLSPNPWVDLYAQNEPVVVNNTLASVTRTNPYIMDQPLLEPTVYPVKSEAGLKVYSGPVRIVGRAGYDRSPNFSYFRRATVSEISEGTEAVSSLAYDDASVLSGGGDVSVALPGRLSVTVGGTYRYAQFEDSDDAVPYFAPFVGHGSISYNSPGNRFLIQLGGDYVGERVVDRDETTRLDALVDLNFSAIYNVNSHVGIAVRAENLLSDDLEVWESYVQTPVRLAAGLRLLW